MLKPNGRKEEEKGIRDRIGINFENRADDYGIFVAKDRKNLDSKPLKIKEEQNIKKFKARVTSLDQRPQA